MSTTVSEYYGGIKPFKVIGRDDFAKHDPSASWDDQGVAIELAADIVRDTEAQMAQILDDLKAGLSQDLKAYGSAQVRDGVVDYAAEAYLDLVVVDGRLCVCMDASNEAAQMRVCWDLADLLRRSASQSMSANDGRVFNAIVQLANELPGAPARDEPEPPRRAQSRTVSRQTSTSAAGRRVVSRATQGLRAE